MDREYSNEMRGALWPVDESERKEKGPVYTGHVTVSGCRLRISMWPEKKVDNPKSKANGKTYIPLTLEYPRGTVKFLAAIRPTDVTVTAAQAEEHVGQTGTTLEDAKDDIPF